MDILIGTKNAYKAAEMTSFIKDIPGVRICLWEELGKEIKVEENQSTLKQNAEKKAVEISRLTNWHVLTSDGGVDIIGLAEKWDVLKNQRMVGEDKTDLEKAERLLELMKDLKGKERKVAYHLALALAKNGRLIWSSEQITDKGFIADRLFNKEIPEYRWMGHLWYYPKYQKIYNRLSEAEKEEVRKQAVGIKRSLRKEIQNNLENIIV